MALRKNKIKRKLKMMARAVSHPPRNAPMLDVAKDSAGIMKHSEISEFLRPTPEKRAYHLFSSILVGLSWVFTYLGALYQNHLLYWAAFIGFVVLSFPPFLLWNNYGLQSLSSLGFWFAVFSIFLEALWLYLLACTLSLWLKKGRK
ncbi:MAG: hypothetical protein V1835_02830 [Candidatus Micrarchaeota archaeon]